MLPDNVAVCVKERPVRVGLSGAHSYELRVVTVGNEADVLAVVLVRVHKSKFIRQRADFILALELPERVYRVRKLLLRHGVENVALILGEVPCLFQHPSAVFRKELRAGVVTGNDVFAAEGASALIQQLELHVAVAVDAGIRGLAVLVGADEPPDNVPLELVHEVENVELHAHRIGGVSRVLGVVGGAAGFFGAGAVGAAAQLHCDAYAVVAPLNHERRRDRAVNSSAHCDERGGLFRHSPSLSISSMQRFAARRSCSSILISKPSRPSRV